MRNIIATKFPDAPKALKEAFDITPREYLYKKLEGDPRGLMDRSMEFVGVDGSTLGNVEFRLFPDDFISILMAPKFVMDTGAGWYEAGKELTRTDPNPWAVAKGATTGITPKVVGRTIEVFGLTDEKGNVHNPSNEGNVTKTLPNSEQKRAYVAGFQPKGTALQRQGEELDLRVLEAQDERRKVAREKLVGAFNNLQIDPEATDRYNEAVKDFVRLYAGSSTTPASMKNVIRRVGMEMNLSPIQLKKLEAIKNAKNNMEVVKFFKDVTGKPQKRSQGE
jgi:hypothetical protein